ncbi:hypothetical protein HY995_03280 [Candidatus Micrarchaeota archaeon]|nr:hypothetical protein [Candidatus Micrarchaeota archaeon]
MNGIEVPRVKSATAGRAFYRRVFMGLEGPLVVSVAGRSGVGKSKLLSNLRTLGIPVFEISYRKLGTLGTIAKKARSDPGIDFKIDGLGIKAAHAALQNRGVVVISGRMAGHLDNPKVVQAISKSLGTKIRPPAIHAKIFLHADPAEAGRRVFKREGDLAKLADGFLARASQLKRAARKLAKGGKATQAAELRANAEKLTAAAAAVKFERHPGVQHAVERNVARDERDRSHYLRRYGVDIFDTRNYGAVIDTTRLTPRQTLNAFLAKMRKAAVREKRWYGRQ